MGSRRLRIGVIATAAGVFSGLFGVGGGSIMVPLLVLWLGYPDKVATGTSLAAIVVVAAVAAIAQAAYGNVDWLRGALVAGPAVLGVLAGTAVQQRVRGENVSLLFAGFLVLVAARLLAG